MPKKINSSMTMAIGVSIIAFSGMQAIPQGAEAEGIRTAAKIVSHTGPQAHVASVAPTQEGDPPGGTYEEGYGLGSQEGHLSGTRDCASLPSGWRPRGWGERHPDLSEYRKGYSDAYEKAYNEVCP